MAWSEIVAQRNRRSRSYQDGAQRRWSGTLTTLHRESTLDSGVFDTAIDATPVRVNNAALDGWLVTANTWHYALGKPKSGALSGLDGVVGFGGRQGAHWLKYRLQQFGYLHWPTRDFTPIGGAATYTRANLSSQVRALTIGPNADTVNVESVATWIGLWTTPGGGDVTIDWKVRGDQLKEEIIVNQVAREWVTANQPPTTPLAETWFGFVLRLDWSGVPTVWRNGAQQSVEEDWSDSDGHGAELRDTLGRLLGLLPIDTVHVGAGKARREATLQKRFWKGGDGNYYLLVGVRCDMVNALPAGALVFDPTVNEIVGVGTDDGHEYPQDTWTSNVCWFGHYGASDLWACTRFQTVNVPNPATIDSATYTLTEKSDEGGTYTVDATVRAQAIDDAAAPAAGNLPSDMTLTAAGTNVSYVSTSWTIDEESEITVTSIIQEIVDRAGWAANQDMNIVIVNNGTTGDKDLEFYDYTGSVTACATLDITYTAGAAPVAAAAVKYYRALLGVGL